jgi:hypothetical protein
VSSNTIKPKSSFNKVGKSTLSSAAALWKLQQNCKARQNPNAFYLTVDVRNGPDAIWWWNIENHLGEGVKMREEVISRVHPRWIDVYNSHRLACYKVMEQQPEVSEMGGLLSFNNKFPLKRANGKYYWYHHVSSPIAFDEEGRMVQFMIEFRVLNPYDNLAPEPPYILVGNEVSEKLTQVIQSFWSEGLVEKILTGVPPVGFKVLHAYRSLATKDENGWVLPGKEQVENHLEMSRVALNKTNGRIIKVAKSALPSIVTSSVSTLAGFLNDMFGPPDKN